MYKGYKYRIYPTDIQKQQISQILGCTRFVYNQTLNKKIEIYENQNKHLSYSDCVNYCKNTLKQENQWLNEVNQPILENAIKNLNRAFKDMLRKNKGYPRYKSKHASRQTYKIKQSRASIVVDFKNNLITLPTLNKVKIIYDRKFEGKILSATISLYSSEKYYISILVNTNHTPYPKSTAVIGLDLGLKDLCITSNGEKYENPKTLYKHQQKLAKAQRQLAHKQKGSKNYYKQKKKVARCFEKIRNIRLDYIHKLTTKIVRENQIIIIEDLSVLKMAQESNLSKSIYDASWSEIVRQLEYKSKWNGRTLTRIDPYYPSSQLCNNCGYKNEEVKKLSIRNWQCPQCGKTHDRDINAAKNILDKGLQQIYQ